jgi:GNAT superfamily N-acetyltransferase
VLGQVVPINNNIVSVAQISSPNRKRIAYNSEVSISVKKDYWRKGMGSAVMEELIRFVKGDSTIKNDIEMFIIFHFYRTNTRIRWIT